MAERLTEARDRGSTVKRLRALLTLDVPWFRRTILVLVPLFAVSLFLIAPFVDAFDQGLGFKVGIATLLFFIALLVEHVATNVTTFENLTATVAQLDTGIQEVKSSVGVQEGVEVYETDSSASQRQLEIIRSKKPMRVKLCEYSGFTMRDQLSALQSNKETTQSVKLLLCHPDKVLSTDQWKLRWLPQLSSLSNDIITMEDARRMGLKIKCYEQPASIRGRHFDGQYIVVGWYTYDSRPHSKDPIQIWGETNPIVIAPEHHAHGKHLADFFDRVFENLWRDAVPLQTALSSYSGDHKLQAAWLEQVSGEE